MQKLHLVGFTTDHEGLILSARRGARSGSYTLVVDESIEAAVEELRLRRVEEAELAEEAEAKPARVESALSVKEVQARLRQGRTVAEVARAAGVEPTWVERFAAPVVAERAQMISRVRSSPLRRPRLGPSRLPIGEAVRQQLADRGVMLTAEEFDAAWTARQVAEGRWSVRFRFHHRAKDQTLRFDLEEAGNQVAAADRLSGQLGYVAPEPVKPPPKVPEETNAKRAVVGSGFRPDPVPSKAASRSAKERERAAAAMRKAAAQRAAEAEKAAARRARERREQLAREAREARAAELAAAREERAAAIAARALEREEEARRKAAEAAAAEKARKAAAKRSRAKAKPAKKAGAAKPAAKRAAPRATEATEPRRAPARSVSAAPRSDAPAPPRPASGSGGADRPPARRAPKPVPPSADGRTAPGATGGGGSSPRPADPTAARRAPRLAAAGSAPPQRRATGPDDGPARPTRDRLVEGGGPSADPAARSAARPVFRSGLVERVSGETAEVPSRSDGTGGGNGSAPTGRPPRTSRPRRTQPLRAT